MNPWKADVAQRFQSEISSNSADGFAQLAQQVLGTTNIPAGILKGSPIPYIIGNNNQGQVTDLLSFGDAENMVKVTVSQISLPFLLSLPTGTHNLTLPSKLFKTPQGNLTYLQYCEANSQ